MQVNDVARAARNAIAIERIDSAMRQMPAYLRGTVDETYTSIFGRTKTRTVALPTGARIAAGEQALLDVRLAAAHLDTASSAREHLVQAGIRINSGLDRQNEGRNVTSYARDNPTDQLGYARSSIMSEVRDERIEGVVELATRRTDEMIAELTASGALPTRELAAASEEFATDLMAQNVRAAIGPA